MGSPSAQGVPGGAHGEDGQAHGGRQQPGDGAGYPGIQGEWVYNQEMELVTQVYREGGGDNNQEMELTSPGIHQG